MQEFHVCETRESLDHCSMNGPLSENRSNRISCRQLNLGEKGKASRVLVRTAPVR